MKKCKQCGLVKPDEQFRPYTPRGKGIRQSTVGRNTHCLVCEKLNAYMAKIWRKETRTEEEQFLLDQAEGYYKQLAAQGCEPVGPFAKHVLGIEKRQTPVGISQLTSVIVTQRRFMEAKGLQQEEDTIMARYNELLTCELVDNPDVYTEILNKILDECALNYVVKPKYVDINLQVIKRLDDYEDNYWKTTK